MDTLLRSERDAIATLGLLARNFLRFDQPISAGEQTTHFAGLNVHCMIVDNSDGEVLAVGNNSIHADENPLQHAEQVVLRAGIERIRRKRPRARDATVEKFYKTSMFMGAGSAPSDFVRRGCTLYNTFSPCAMCSCTLLIAYMKRVAYVIPDEKYEGFYDKTKSEYFPTRESTLESVQLEGETSPLVDEVRTLRADLLVRVEELLRAQLDLIHVLDRSIDVLKKAFEMLAACRESSLVTVGDDRTLNLKTLSDVKSFCGLPTL